MCCADAGRVVFFDGKQRQGNAPESSDRVRSGQVRSEYSSLSNRKQGICHGEIARTTIVSFLSPCQTDGWMVTRARLEHHIIVFTAGEVCERDVPGTRFPRTPNYYFLITLGKEVTLAPVRRLPYLG
jgi:hypothetical protein